MYKYLEMIYNRETEPSPVGSRYVDEHILITDERGNQSLKVVGQTNISEMINSYEVLDAETLIARYIDGDETALNVRQGVYLDTTLYPKTLAEAQTSISIVTDLWERLPQNTKKEYNNDVKQFIAQVTEDDLAAIFETQNSDGQSKQADKNNPAIKDTVPSGTDNMAENKGKEE